MLFRSEPKWYADSTYSISWLATGDYETTYSLNWNTSSNKTVSVSDAQASSEWSNEDNSFSWSVSNILTDDGANGESSRWGAAGENGYAGEWVVLNLNKESTIGGCILDEFEKYGAVTGFEIQYDNNGTWKTIYTGNKIGEQLEVTFTHITTTKIRLYITSASNVNINYFGLYGTGLTELKKGIEANGSFIWNVPSSYIGTGGYFSINRESSKNEIVNSKIVEIIKKPST